MPGSDKKDQQLAERGATAGGGEILAIQSPDVSGFVMAGAPSGLIPRVKLDTDQKTTIAIFATLPPDGETDNFYLQVARHGSNEWTELAHQTYTGTGDPDDWVPLDFIIPSTFFLKEENEGAFNLRYHHENYAGAPDTSLPVPIYIDKIPPSNGTQPGKMQFTVTLPITDTTFGGNDYLEATIPIWSGDQTDVKIYFAWLKGELPEDPGGIDFIGPQDISPNGTIQIPKDKFLAAGDGFCCGGYVLQDKAGNFSPLSSYELMSVALGPLPPVPLDLPSVVDATGGELLRIDIIDEHVMVNVPKVTNGKPEDRVVVKWGATSVLPGTPVGSNPTSGINILVPWATLWAEYGAGTTGVKNTSLSYTVLRGVEPYGSAEETVQCNFSAPGPVNPNPDPGNPLLKAVTVVGGSGTDNVLVESDENKLVEASIELVDPLVDGDSYQVMWNGAAIGDAYVIDTAADVAGEKRNIELDWDVIRAAGPSATMPVWYTLSSAAHGNPQEPDPHTPVQIEFLVFKLPEAVPQHLHDGRLMNCNALRWKAGGTGSEYGFEYLIPPSEHLKQGDTVKVTWNAYKDYGNPTALPDASKTATFPDISQEQAEQGIVWLIEPYDVHILPIWDSVKQIGKGEVTYLIEGKPAQPSPTNTQIALAQGEGSCNVPANP